MAKTIRAFFDLNAWKEARKLTSNIYLKTKSFPVEENFGLTSQMRRSAVSIMSNVAEGFGRISIKEKLHFYSQSNGSLTELQSHILIASDLKYISQNDCKELFNSTRSVQSLIQGLMRSTRNRLT